jgi:hypothetical protein
MTRLLPSLGCRVGSGEGPQSSTGEIVWRLEEDRQPLITHYGNAEHLTGCQMTQRDDAVSHKEVLRISVISYDAPRLDTYRLDPSLLSGIDSPQRC